MRFYAVCHLALSRSHIYQVSLMSNLMYHLLVIHYFLVIPRRTFLYLKQDYSAVSIEQQQSDFSKTYLRLLNYFEIEHYLRAALLIIKYLQLLMECPIHYFQGAKLYYAPSSEAATYGYFDAFRDLGLHLRHCFQS